MGSLFMRLCPEERPPPPLQQQVQHLQQQIAHSAPQKMQRAMQVMTEMRMIEPTTIPAMTGHLQYDLAMQLSHEEKVLRASSSGFWRG